MIGGGQDYARAANSGKPIARVPPSVGVPPATERAQFAGPTGIITGGP